MEAAAGFPNTGAQNWTPTVRNVELSGPAGKLEALLNQGAPDAALAAPYAALICHPNPAYGGTMHHKVVYRAMKVFNAPEWGLGWPVLRFNFRGVGLSQGAQDGKAEVEDVLAALDWLDHEFHRPVFVAGFSFGSAMALWACCGPQKTSLEIRGVAALGLPTHADGRDYRYRFLREATIPKLFLSGAQDTFGPEEQLRQVTESAAQPRRLVLIPGADHFFTDHLEPMQQALSGWVRDVLSDSASGPGAAQEQLP